MVIYPILFMFQGLDFTDQGYWLTGYQRIFQDPESVSSMMTTWLSLVIGGLVEKIGLGVISFRIAFVIVTWMTLWLAYRFLREFFGRREILFPLFVTLVYVTKWGVNWISYNDLSAIFFLGASLVLWFGLQAKNHKLIFLAGFILGVSVFLRISNLAGLSLVLVLPFSAWLYKSQFSSCFKSVILFFVGYIVGLLFILILMQSLGHLQFFIMGVSQFLQLASHSTYHHSSSSLIKMFVTDHALAFSFGFLIVIAIIFIARLKALKLLVNLNSKYHWITFSFLSTFITTILVLCISHSSAYRWALPGFCYTFLLAGIVKESMSEGSKSHALLYFFALIIFLTLPLGSGNGIGNAIYGSWLALPLSLLILIRFSKLPNLDVDKNQKDKYLLNGGVLQNIKNNLFVVRSNPKCIDWLTYEYLSKLISLAVLLFSMYFTYVSTYRDGSDRSSLRYKIAVPELEYVLTSKSRSIVVEELLVELKGIVKPNDSLLAVTDIPMLNYLTHTRPYLSNSWTGIMGLEELTSELSKIDANSVTLPVVVRTKGSVHKPEWPNVQIEPGYLGDGEIFIKEFMLNNGFFLRWENQWFEIWVPS